MARSSLDDCLSEEESSSRRHYSAPENPAVPPQLLSDIIGQYFSSPLPKSVEWVVSLNDLAQEDTEQRFKRYAFEIQQMLEPYEDTHFDPAELLDTLVSHCARQSIGFKVHCGSPLTMLVQALYNLGHNDFSLDFSQLGVRVLDAGNLLRGTEERPLRLRIRGETNFTGVNIEHVSIDGCGKFYFFGYNAQDCDFTLEGKATCCGRLRDCSYELDGHIESAMGNCWRTTLRLHGDSDVDCDFSQIQGSHNTVEYL